MAGGVRAQIRASNEYRIVRIGGVDILKERKGEECQTKDTHPSGPLKLCIPRVSKMTTPIRSGCDALLRRSLAMPRYATLNQWNRRARADCRSFPSAALIGEEKMDHTSGSWEESMLVYQRPVYRPRQLRE